MRVSMPLAFEPAALTLGRALVTPRPLHQCALLWAAALLVGGGVAAAAAVLPGAEALAARLDYEYRHTVTTAVLSWADALIDQLRGPAGE
ncbi:MAG: hypothetical protein L0Y66_21610 [Myxococcaceae bacterium]|nr:hypothetical protein [Myxococcaceae bacterium]MCI0671276.1 hypothetical protein [Myxococcaceae bacterium]